MDRIYDLIIIGCGPAGLTAAIYAVRAGLSFLLLEGAYAPGGQAANTGVIENYPGLPGIQGSELSEAMARQAEGLGASITEAEVAGIELLPEGVKRVCCRDAKAYEAKAVVIASGTSHRRLGVPGEEELEGCGVSYCAVCDGAFFRGRTAVVVGGGNTAADDAVFLAGICKEVKLIHRRDTLRADRILQERLRALENVALILNATVEEICGDGAVEAVLVRNKTDGTVSRMKTDAVFAAVGTEPQTEWCRGLLDMDPVGYIRAGEDCATNIPGIFVAGDVRTKKLRQIVTAVSDGACAIKSVQEYLNAWS